MPEPRWILERAVLGIHASQLSEHGGAAGLRDAALLSSALDRPKNLYHFTDPKPNLAVLAASYAYGLSQNHAFVDGNKRVALVVCQLFLRLNGKQLQATQEEKYITFMKLAAGEVLENDLGKWIEDYMMDA